MTDEQLPHGFTLTELDATAAKAAHSSPWRQVAFRQRFDIAQFAVLELLHAADERPDFWALVKAGQRAIHAYAVKELHHRGLVARTGAPGGVPITRYWTYWQSIATSTESYEDHIVEAIAVRQIVSTLRYSHLQVIRALADYDDYTLAAESLGKARKGFITTLCVARQLCLQLWHEHETPSKIWGHDRRSTRTRRDRGGSKSITVTTVRRRRTDRRRASQQPAASRLTDDEGDM